MTCLRVDWYNGRKQRYKLTSHYASPTLRMETLMCSLAIGSIRGYSFRSADVSTAFLYAELPTGVKLYAEIPEGHPDFEERRGKVLQVMKNLYGLKEAPLLWWRHFQSAILKSTKVLRALGKQFKMTRTDLDTECDFLGALLKKDEDGNFVLSQRPYIAKMLQKYCPAVPVRQTPLPLDYDLSHRRDQSEKMEVKPYQTMLGSLSFLRLTRVDCVHALHQLARFASGPTRYSYKCMYQLFGYIKGTAMNFAGLGKATDL